jgi:hypothetical protein
MPHRDLEGYAGAWPSISWPNAGKLAVAVVINVEEGAELQGNDGDACPESMAGVISVVPAGKRDRARSLPGAPWLVVPCSLDSNDMKVFHRNGFVRTRGMVEHVTDALDVLEAEAPPVQSRLPSEDRRAPRAVCGVS